jgi:hypothetical protein
VDAGQLLWESTLLFAEVPYSRYEQLRVMIEETNATITGIAE